MDDVCRVLGAWTPVRRHVVADRWWGKRSSRAINIRSRIRRRDMAVATRYEVVYVARRSNFSRFTSFQLAKFYVTPVRPNGPRQNMSPSALEIANVVHGGRDDSRGPIPDAIRRFRVVPGPYLAFFGFGHKSTISVQRTGSWQYYILERIPFRMV